jgi:hypothetical protein
MGHALEDGRTLTELSNWVPFDRLMDSYDRADATDEDALALIQGRQGVLPSILSRTQPGLKSLSHPTSNTAIYHAGELLAIARQDDQIWSLERVFTPLDSD